MLLFLIIVIILLIIIILFSFPQFSPIPYFPSNKKDLPLIIDSLHLKNKQTVFDLGAGDGTVIFAAAQETWKKKLNTKFIAVEINPILVCILYVRRIFHPSKKNIRIMCENIFTMNYSLNPTPYALPPTFYLYISPWYLEKVISNLKFQISNFNVVSYMYPIKTFEPVTIIKGKNTIYIYRVF